MKLTFTVLCAECFTIKRVVCILLATQLCGNDAAAARPFATDDAGTVVPSTFELETAADVSRETTASGIVLKHGVTDRADLGFSASYTTGPNHGAGFDALVASVKYAFVPGRVAATVTGAFDGESYCANLIYSHPIQPFRFDANCGLQVDGLRNPAQITYSLAAQFCPKWFTVGMETGGCGNLPDRYRIGFQLPLSTWMAIDIGVGGNFGKNVALTATSGVWLGF